MGEEGVLSSWIYLFFLSPPQVSVPTDPSAAECLRYWEVILVNNGSVLPELFSRRC